MISAACSAVTRRLQLPKFVRSLPCSASFAYRGTRQHYYLTEDMALYNAANCEQVAANQLDSGEDPPPAGRVAAARSGTADPALLAATLLAIQITRSWAYSVVLKGGDDPARAAKTIDTPLGLPTASGAEPLRRALLTGLEAGLQNFMDCIRKGVTFSLGAYAADVETTMTSSTYDIKVQANLASPYSARQLAGKALRKMCNTTAANNRVPFSSPQLYAYLSSFEAFQEGRLQGMVSTYLGGLGPA